MIASTTASTIGPLSDISLIVEYTCSQIHTTYVDLEWLCTTSRMVQNDWVDYTPWLYRACLTPLSFLAEVQIFVTSIQYTLYILEMFPEADTVYILTQIALWLWLEHLREMNHIFKNEACCTASCRACIYM